MELRRYKYILILILFYSCYISNLKTKFLKDNITKVPIDSSVYVNRNKFNDSILTDIDTNVFYCNYTISDGWTTTIRFYSNGFVNIYFYEGSEIPKKDFFNPEIRGRRGIYYYEKNKLRLDKFVSIDGQGHLGLSSSTLIISGDSLIEIRDVDTRYPSTYIKRRMPKEYFEYKANW